MGSYEGDGLQDQGTDKNGTHESDYKCHCLYTRTPRNDALCSNPHLNPVSLCTEKHGGHLEQLT
jgi:hypothetical protein